MKFHTKVASFGTNGGQSYALCMLLLLVVVLLALFIYMPSRGVGGSHALHGAFVYDILDGEGTMHNSQFTLRIAKRVPS